MCGISGFYAPNSHFTIEDLKAMTAPLEHRGPDAEGYFHDGICGMGHRRLSILDTSANANQPMYSQDGRYIIVFNGEVYNFRELAKQIAFPLKTNSDTEVILEFFARQHTRFVYHLNGMFSIAIYDLNEKALYLFRDRIGIKPLYYYWNPNHNGQGLFLFASELKSLTNVLSRSQKEVNEEAVSDFLHLGYIPAPNSIYKNVHKLPAGSWLKVSSQGMDIRKYWDVREKIYDTATQERLSLLNREAEAKKQLSKLLASSIKYRMISDVPLGIFLSGGIDSSTIAALANSQSAQPVKTFSIGFKEEAFNEAPHARAVAERLGTQHEEFIVSIEEAKALLPQLLDMYDEPFADSSALPTFLVSRLARQRVTVALGGDGGDELFFGYGMYQWAGRLSKGIYQNLRKPISRSLGLMPGSRYQKASHLFDYKNRQELASHIFSQEQMLFSRKELDSLMVKASPKRRYSFSEFNRSLSAMEQQAIFDLQYYLPDDLLVKVDRATMQNSLEARVPLLDHRLVEFAVNISPNLKYKNGVRKYLLKQVLYDFLPEELFNRPKQGFSIPLANWLQGDLNYLIEEYLNEKLVKQYSLVRYEAVLTLKNKFKKGQTHYYNRLWALILLHQFMSKHF